ncbi:uncharacterized protein BJ171DRAFT_205660 [Polychytrium aggregatum]|uniref:uncharacterized protein n=1 Tax=Polychytrium aggregatum TaxID=110093 RepID=UPI0022FEFCE1|nr:uncharacterized protein BJ171DRAFT_205660 [Polychytrium aggregatum]KAI9199650.1 hypothetical protein BJ171DRAFT_205660 [Polychytrium aggregatum]
MMRASQDGPKNQECWRRPDCGPRCARERCHSHLHNPIRPARGHDNTVGLDSLERHQRMAWFARHQVDRSSPPGQKPQITGPREELASLDACNRMGRCLTTGGWILNPGWRQSNRPQPSMLLQPVSWQLAKDDQVRGSIAAQPVVAATEAWQIVIWSCPSSSRHPGCDEEGQDHADHSNGLFHGIYAARPHGVWSGHACAPRGVHTHRTCIDITNKPKPQI